MILTNKQEEGLKTIVSRYKAKEKYTVISGYAGTGKSTLVKFAIEALKVDKKDVAYACFTGKAAEVLRKKGNDGACTLHHLLYDFFPQKNGSFYRKRKEYLKCNIVVADECSMIPKEMVKILLSFGVYVIFLGDPFQLPCVNKEDDNGLLNEPHVFLDEIMRQAAESEIIQMTMQIREGKPIKPFLGKEVRVYKKNEYHIDMMKWADQVICATNDRRNILNNEMRKTFGYDGGPKVGEKLICLSNYWNICNSEGDALVNGTSGIISSISKKKIILPLEFGVINRKFDVYNINFIPEGSKPFENTWLDMNFIDKNKKTFSWKDECKISKAKNKEPFIDFLPKEFTYGYAITCHKAQGSEWEKVLVIEENFPFDKAEHARWLYTACTRAEDKLVVILK